MRLSDYFPFLEPPAPKFVTEDGEAVYGIMAEFDTPAAIYHAAEKVRDAGYEAWDAYSPFPIHGMEDAMGVRRTKLPIIVAIVGFTGVGCALAMQWWMNYMDFPLVVQGKPFDAWEPFTPVVFELGVLFAAFACLFGMLMMNGLPQWYQPLLKKERFLKTSDDRFVICVEASDPKFDPEATRQLLQDAGGTHIDLVEE
jgi:hypothetical protein